MTSDFLSAQVHLERAQRCLCGTDKSSLQLRDAIDLLIEAAMIAEYSQRPAENVVQFPKRGDPSQNR
jgi:hypothetical protein